MRRVATRTDAWITRRRPKRSETTLSGMTMNARPPVVAETVSAASEGEMPKSSDSAGRTAWVAYRALYEARPEHKEAMRAIL